MIASAIGATVALSVSYITPKLKSLLERKRAPKIGKLRVPQSVVVVDGSNVALYGEKRKKGRILNILLMMKTLEDRGFKVYTVVDASLRHKIDSPQKLERLIESGKIIQVPPGTPADYFILSIAESEYGIVVSNDVFKEWKGMFPWVNDKRRVVRYLVVNERVYLYPDVRPKKKWKGAERRVRTVCIDLEEVQESYWKRYIM